MATTGPQLMLQSRGTMVATVLPQAKSGINLPPACQIKHDSAKLLFISTHNIGKTALRKYAPNEKSVRSVCGLECLRVDSPSTNIAWWDDIFNLKNYNAYVIDHSYWYILQRCWSLDI